ncbi:MAG: hypothetical protein P4L99_28075 [Chthoniobacter sp.]|nr:hypothetical protein [Chthoniobacter sp.]
MATPKPEPKIDARVARGYQLRQEIADRQAELAKLEAELIQDGSQRFQDAEGRTCTAVGAVAGGTTAHSYALRDGEDENARKIAGEHFGELFERKVIFEVKPGFRDRANALLTPAKERDILALCLVPGKPYSGKKAYVLWK